MYFPVIIFFTFFCSELKEVKAACSSDNDQKICVAPDVMRALMNIKDVKDDKIKPAFYASLKAHPFTLKGTDDVVKFDDVRINRGKGYDPSTGHFTAPRKGLYQISCMLFGYPGEYLHYQISKNDSAYLIGHIEKSKLLYQSQTLVALVEMKKGDRVFIKHRDSRTQRVHGAHYSNFSGYFLHE